MSAENTKQLTAELGIDIAEPFTDSLLNDGIIKDMPVLGSALKIAYLCKSINDHFFVRKVERFIFCLRTIGQKKVYKFLKSLEHRKYRKKVGEVIVLLLNRYDDLEKPEIMAEVFKAYIQGAVNFDQFYRLCSGVDKAFISDLKLFVSYTKPEGMEFNETPQHIKNLLTTGFTEIKNIPDFPKLNFGKRGGGSPHWYGTTDLGELYVEIMRKEKKI